ncbi:NAD-dependent epimerase/dehydratase family protein [Mucilaginibacter arboris]|uniref:NAD-dependent epimerase/dehydratase family protein n=1 Tax=Mucilaginibacter arboris TaxID=2682090 RepID=A0A7K1SUT5_9SPHI|nr:NAD-dependent epimerase/dehydratase family protein [Mucilaginibacter arboris]MVN20998.1 NAD-dependent epimerase/dehydratase family protein [Mucilaginibacter arboris]
MNKVLVTGVSGFVGSNLSTYFNTQENKIVPLHLRKGVKENSLDDIYMIIHLAGKAHDLKKTSNPEEYYQVNFELTKKLYNAFLTSKAKKFIFVSSVKAAADMAVQVLTEDVVPNPKTDYGKSKLMAEQYIQNQPLPEGKSYYILRPCMIHGPGNKGNLNLLYQVVKKGIPYPLAGFQNKRSFLSVENLCFIIKELISRDDIESGIYQVADDEALSTNKVVSILAASLNRKPHLWNIPTNLIAFFAKIGDVLHLPLTTERLGKLTESYIVSNTKIKAAIQKELPLTAKEGLQKTAASFSKV